MINFADDLRQPALRVSSSLRVFLIALTILSLIFSTVYTPRAHAFPSLGDALDLVFDPLKLGKGSTQILEAVERIQTVASELRDLEGKTNDDLKARIEQVQTIIDNVISAVDRNVANLSEIIANAERSLANLEQQIYKDAIDLLYRAQCVAEVVTSDQLQRGVAKAVQTLAQAHPRIRLLGITIIDLSSDNIKIDAPDQAYISLRDAYLQDLSNIKPNDKAYEIVSAYSNISRMARFARCSYLDKPNAQYFISEEAKYDRLVNIWMSIVIPKM